MALGDVTLLNSQVATGAKRYAVASGTTASIAPGDVVIKTLGAVVVSKLNDVNTKPVVGTDYVVGIAQTYSNETAAAAGYVMVQDLLPGQIWLIAPKVAATWDTQSEYDALVGKRVLLDSTAGTVTILAADGATSGCVIEYLDVSKHPGKVAFSFRDGLRALA